MHIKSIKIIMNNTCNDMLSYVLPRIAKRPINLTESLKNLKPTGFGLRMERIKPPLVVENPTK